MLILGVETSCDETAAALIKTEKDHPKILSNIVASQVPLHKKYGGIVPEVAARAHTKKIIPVIKEALKKGEKDFFDIDLLAVTKGPGLVTSLLVGVETLKTFSFATQKPLIGINHLKAHIYTNLLQNPNLPFPAISLIASGGHTEISLLKENSYRQLGETRDDAAGECFDKIAKILGLGYPGGPEISKQAQKWKEKNNSNKNQKDLSLPRPMINSDNFDFSFSGLKTAVLYKVKEDPKKLDEPEFIQKMSFATQEAITDVLVEKVARAIKKHNPKSVLLSGGVAANQILRSKLKKKVKNISDSIQFFVPEISLCTDNGAMIATTAYFEYKNMSQKEKDKLKKTWKNLRPDPSLKI